MPLIRLLKFSVLYVEGKISDVGGYEMAGSGYSNMTPWKLPRDLDEDQLYVKLEELVSQVKNMSKGILCIHFPPTIRGWTWRFTWTRI